MTPNSFSGVQLVLLGLSLLTVGLVLWRGFIRGRKSRGRDLTAEVRKEMLDAEQTVSGRMEKLEVRLHDYGREVEGRIGTRIALLNQLLIEADRKIERLQKQSTPPEDDTPASPSPDKNTPDKNTPDKNTPDKNTPDKNTPDKPGV